MVSIVMPTYKEPPLLEYTISGILDQTSPDWELIVVDNADDDQSYYFNKWLDNHNIPDDVRSKIKVIEVKNEGPMIGKYKLIGLEHTTCGEDDFVLFHDSDDIIMPTLVENIINIGKQYPVHEMISADCISCCHFEDENGSNIFSNLECYVSGEKVDGIKLSACIINRFRSIAFYFSTNVWSMTHPYHISMQPKIFRKRAFTNNRICFNRGPQDDSYYHSVLGMFLPEVYIDDIQICYVCYFTKNNETTYCKNHSCYFNNDDTIATDNEKCIHGIVDTALDAIHYRKIRDHYKPTYMIRDTFNNA